MFVVILMEKGNKKLIKEKEISTPGTIDSFLKGKIWSNWFGKPIKRRSTPVMKNGETKYQRYLQLQPIGLRQ